MLRLKTGLSFLTAAMVFLGMSVLGADVARAADPYYCVTPLKTTLRDGVTAIARLCIEDIGAQRVKSFGLERSTPTDNPWIQFIVSDGTSRTYSFYDLAGEGYAITYYVATWRLCDPYAGYCTNFVPIAK